MKHYYTVLKIIVSIFLLLLLFYKIDINLVITKIKKVDILLFIVSIFMIFVITTLQSIRFYLLVIFLGGYKNNKRLFTLVNSIKINFISLFFNQLLPSTIGGDGYKVLKLHSLEFTLKYAFQTVVVDRLFGLLFLITVIIFSAPYSLNIFFSYSISNYSYLIICILFLIIVVIIYLLLSNFSVFLSSYSTGEYLLNFLLSFRIVFSNLKLLLIVFFTSVLSILIYATSVYVISKSLMLELKLIDSLIIMPFVILISVIPFSIAGWGIRESALVFCFGFVGMSQGDSMSISILIGIIGLISSLPGGFLLFFSKYKYK